VFDLEQARRGLQQGIGALTAGQARLLIEQGSNMNKERAIQLMHLLAASVGGTVSDVKLMALLYFVERKTFEKYASFIIYDDHFSGAHGPVLEGCSAIIEGNADVRFTKVFNQPENVVSPEGVVMKRLNLKAPVDDITSENLAFDCLSDADHETITEVLATIGALGDDEIIRYATDPRHCPEWVKPEVEGVLVPITSETLMSHMDFPASEIESHAQEIQYWKFINTHSLFATD
jgi:hypothetical protein